MFYGQIMMRGYLKDPEICFCAIGDVTCDDAPIQISDFGQGAQIDQLITKSYLEGGGGSGFQESYEIAAYFFAKNCDLINSELPFFFITGDERFYAKVTSKIISEIFDYKSKEKEYDSKELWRELCQKFNVFHLHKPYENKNEDMHIVTHWKQALGEERIIVLENPKACIDTILGIIALVSGKRTLREYVNDMMERNQSEIRIDEVVNSLNGITQLFIEENVIGDLINSNYDINYLSYLFAKKTNINEKKFLCNEDEEEKRSKIKHKKTKKEKSKSYFNIKNEKIEEKHSILSQLKENNESNKIIPHEFFCPITLELMKDPVMIEDGNTYERKSIELWLNNNNKSPLTNLELKSKNILPNNSLKRVINDFFKSENKN